jgi:hypothetical protein
MRISVNYEDSDVAKALEKIIKDPNSAEFVKLLTPMLCGSNNASTWFFKLMLGNKLPEIIPNNTLCFMPVNQLGYGADKPSIEASDLCIDGGVIVTIVEFRGYHEWSPYTYQFTNVSPEGIRTKITAYTGIEHLTVIADI